MDYRSRALNQMLDSQQTNTARFVEAFNNVRFRPPRLDDLPHWQQLDLAPNPAHVDFDSVYLPVLQRVTLRMAQLNHPPVIANPLWPAQLALLETHMNHWKALRSQLQQPDSEAGAQEFSSQFQAVAAAIRMTFPRGITSFSPRTSLSLARLPGQNSKLRLATTCYAH